MKQKSRFLIVASWLVLRLRWSLIFIRRSLSNGGRENLWTKPGIILFARQYRQFPLDSWNFDKHCAAYIYSRETEKSLRVCLLPEISCN
jgi:hypothetical protein